jgi:hypothetical protein
MILHSTVCKEYQSYPLSTHRAGWPLDTDYQGEVQVVLNSDRNTVE